MKILIALLVLAISFSTSICKADIVLRPIIITSEKVTVDHPLPQQDSASHSIAGRAQTAVFTPEAGSRDFASIYDRVNDAQHLEDLRPILSDRYFQLLKAKVKSGVSQYMVLAMIQAMRPSAARIFETHIKGSSAELMVAGSSKTGAMRGLIHLVKKDDFWKIDDESWYAEGIEPLYRGGLVDSNEHLLSAKTKFRSDAPAGLIERVSPHYAIKDSLLSLTKVSQGVRKESLMFVFLMNKDKDTAGKGKDKERSKVVLSQSNRNHMHLMWTGSAKLLPKQMIVEGEYPMDFSIAKYADGFASDEWNLVLPNKKPREVMISLLWTF